MEDFFRLPFRKASQNRFTKARRIGGTAAGNLFQPDRVSLTYIDLDRTVVGSAVPTVTALLLPTDDAIRAACFTERRELGILNIGGAGEVAVNGKSTRSKNSMRCTSGEETRRFGLRAPTHRARRSSIS
jgi:5-keto 4-deoxyuronate isomerase